MQPKQSKILKRIGISIVAIIFLLVAIIGIVFQFVLTPEKITPRVVTALNKNLNAELSLGAVELTFFKTFPSFKLELTDGVIVKPLDTTVAPSDYKALDTLMSFESAVASVNPIAFLRDKIKVNEFTFSHPKIYALISPDGETNWDILKEKNEVEKAQDSIISPSEKEPFQADIDLENVSIINGNLIFDDRYTENYYKIEGFDMNLEAEFNEKKILLDLKLDSDEIVYRKKEGTFTDNLAIKLISDFEVDRKNKNIDIKEAELALNDLTFKATGRLKPDKPKKEIDVDLDLTLAVPTLNTLIDLIPETIFDKSEKYSARGEALITAKILGLYKKGLVPSVQANLLIKDGSLSFDNKPNQIELIQINADLFIPPDKGSASNFKIEEMRLKGAGTDLSFTGSGHDLFNSGSIDMNFEGTMDLDAFEKTMPFKKDIDLDGKAEVSMNAVFRLADINKQDYGRIQALGKLNLNQILYHSPSDSLRFKLAKGHLLTGQDQNSSLLTAEKTKVLGGKIEIDGLEYNHGLQSQGYLDKFEAKFASTPLRDSSQVATLKASIVIDNGRLISGDSLKAKISHLSGDLKLNPKKGSPKTPEITSIFKVDSTGAIYKGKRIGLVQARYDIKTSKVGKNWPLEGKISFGTLYAFTPKFPLPVKIPKTLIVLKPGLIELDHAKLIVGKSDLIATGRVYNIGDAFFEDQVFKGELEIESSLIDANEMIQALNQGAKVTTQEMEVAMNDLEPETDLSTVSTPEISSEVSSEPRSFVIPDNLDLRLQSRFKKVVYKRFTIDKVAGLITVKDQKLDLANLQMTTMAAKMRTSIAYATPNEKSASLDFDFRLYEIDLAKLIVLFPVIDSLLPMADSFEGKVNFRMKGDSQVDESLGIVAPSLDAIARVEGDNLVILDGKTFQKIAKMLFFKNKDRNTIDKLEFAMIFENKAIEVFPSVITVDRYKVAIGGQHKLDMTYDYHISILKSPMPFKAGIDIKGTEDDLDFKITKAKYKYLFSTKARQQRKADSTIIRQKNAIMQRLPFYGD